MLGCFPTLIARQRRRIEKSGSGLLLVLILTWYRYHQRKIYLSRQESSLSIQITQHCLNTNWRQRAFLILLGSPFTAVNCLTTKSVSVEHWVRDQRGGRRLAARYAAAAGRPDHRRRHGAAPGSTPLPRHVPPWRAIRPSALDVAGGCDSCRRRTSAAAECGELCGVEENDPLGLMRPMQVQMVISPARRRDASNQMSSYLV